MERVTTSHGSHTDEPWETSRNGEFIEKRDGEVIVQTIAIVYRPEDAARIKACVNYCRGIGTDAIEQKLSDGLHLPEVFA